MAIMDSGDEMVPLPGFAGGKAFGPKAAAKKAVAKPVTKRPAARSAPEAGTRGAKASPSRPLATLAEMTLDVINGLNANVKPSSCPHQHAGIRVGSACSGWCSEVYALKRLGKQFTLCFACDIDKKVKTLVHHTMDHHHWFDDMTKADFQAAPSVDVFMVGFPCQPWSPAGLRKGSSDARSQPVLFALAYMLLHQPAIAILENVAGLYREHANFFCLLLSTMESMLDERGAKLYDISWQLLNCKTHGGLPQNRERLFIVAVKRSCSRSAMVWPGETAMRPLQDILDAPTRKRKSQAGADPSAKLSKSCAINLRKGFADVVKAGGDPERESTPLLYAIFGLLRWKVA